MTLSLNKYATGPTAVGGSKGSVAAPSGTDENVLATFSVPALRKHDKLRVTALYSHTNSANNKTIKVKLGATVLASKVTTSVAGDKLVAEIANVGATNVQIGEAGAAGAIETGAGAAVLTITGTKATGGETLTLAHWTVELIQLPE